MTDRLGFSGRLARYFLRNQLTPLLGLAALLLGAFAVLVTPREEEPQIDVTFANVFIAFPGATAAQVEAQVATPMEHLLSELSGVKHIYSASSPGLAVISVQFEVGQPRTEAIVRLYNALYSNPDWRPAGLGVLPPIVKPKGIDDVPILSLTLWSRKEGLGNAELGQVARAMETEIQRVPGTRNVYTLGSNDDAVHVQLDPQRLAAHQLTVPDLMQALQSANLVQAAGELVADNRVQPVQAGEFLANADDVAGLVVASTDGHPVYLSDVATIARGTQHPTSYVWFGTGKAAAQRGLPVVSHAAAVTIAISKKPGENAIDVADRVEARVAQLRGSYLPEGVELTVTRNYGVTANDKARKLIQKLLFATASVVLLVALTMGRREALVVGAAVIVTLAATLFASWAWGFTINRVSLFALIFSIGILVDDAIVIVENIHRRRELSPHAPLLELIPAAVDEVGGPTILATFTVIAALLPMAFVSGLMGPYMSPIPINSSLGMLISLGIALVFTPWLVRVTAGPHSAAATASPSRMDQRVSRLFERIMRPMLMTSDGRKRRHRLYVWIAAAIVISIALVVVRAVVLKMLPFDNKSEFQVVVNMPEGTTLETTARVLDELAVVIEGVPEVTDYQAYAGTSAPINFNGLVRQYYLRQSAELGDLQVNLLDKHQRDRQSHDIALAVRPALAAIGRRHGASVQVVEVPPGPPVLAPIVAEIYGADAAQRQVIAQRLRRVFDSTADVVDTDDSVVANTRRNVLDIDRQKAAIAGVPQSLIADTLAVALQGRDITFLHSGGEIEPTAVRLELPVEQRAEIESALQLRLRTSQGKLVPLSEWVTARQAAWDGVIQHKDLLPLSVVSGDMAGRLDSPLYAMFSMVGRVSGDALGMPVQQNFVSQPDDAGAAAIKWDGEWQITYETFRDMGLAYSVGLLLIYLLVVAQFGSYFVPLIIMAPIPLTIIGVMPGHALLGAQFTATSMIGMIALAGIIVRNSILLVDFINTEVAAGTSLADAVVRAGAVRARPIVLTGLAAMIGALFILDDPIFNGLAISLIFGILVSTLLTLVLIPVLYFAYRSRLDPRPNPEE